MERTYEIICTHKKDKTDIIILYQGDLASTMSMFGWYEAHKRFYNGLLEVREIGGATHV